MQSLRYPLASKPSTQINQLLHAQFPALKENKDRLNELEHLPENQLHLSGNKLTEEKTQLHYFRNLLCKDAFNRCFVRIKWGIEKEDLKETGTYNWD